MKENNKRSIEPIKIGNFISKCRKEKGLTQEDLAVKFGITSQSVSKWENGKAIPDMSLWQGICECLDINLSELLYGEEDVEFLSKKEKESYKEQAVIEGAFYQTKKVKRKYIKIIFILLLVFCVTSLCFLFTYYINNYNKVNIYNISGSDNLLLNGKVIFNPQKQTIIINRINYDDLYSGTDKEIETNKINLKIVYENNIIYETNVNNESNKKLNYYLDQIHIEESDTLSKDEYVLLKSSINDLELIIKYYDQKGITHELSFKLNLEEEFSNNNLFY